MVVEKQHLTVDGTKVVILHIVGLIKLGESAEFFLFAFNAQTWTPNVVINIAKVDYIDSTGLGELLGVCIALARSGRNLVLLNPSDVSSWWSVNPRIESIIRMARATHDIRVFDNKDEAIAAVIASAPPPAEAIADIPAQEKTKPSKKKP